MGCSWFCCSYSVAWKRSRKMLFVNCCVDQSFVNNLTVFLLIVKALMGLVWEKTFWICWMMDCSNRELYGVYSSTRGMRALLSGLLVVLEMSVAGVCDSGTTVVGCIVVVGLVGDAVG